VLSEGERTGLQAGAELLVFVALCALATWRVEGGLLREMAGYVRPRRASAA
jgi:hypothetical protein